MISLLAFFLLLLSGFCIGIGIFVLRKEKALFNLQQKLYKYGSSRNLLIPLTLLFIILYWYFWGLMSLTAGQPLALIFLYPLIIVFGIIFAPFIPPFFTWHGKNELSPGLREQNKWHGRLAILLGILLTVLAYVVMVLMNQAK